MDDDRWQALVGEQSGLLRRNQLKDLGITREQLRWRLARSWQLVLPQVVDVTGESMTSSRQLIAAALEAGESAVISGHRACLWHGLENARGNRPVLALVGPGQASRTAQFVQIRRTRRPILAPWTSGVVRLAPPPRAIVDAARGAHSQDEATSIILEAVQRRLVSLDELTHELEAGARVGSAFTRRAIGLGRAGAWSVPESGLLQACARSTILPHVWPNPELRLPDGKRLLSPDLWLDDVGMAIMVHSVRHHFGGSAWQRTVEQDGQLQEVGVLVLAFTPGSIGRDVARVLTRIERTYQQTLTSGRQRPDVQMIPRGPGLV